MSAGNVDSYIIELIVRGKQQALRDIEEVAQRTTAIQRQMSGATGTAGRPGASVTTPFGAAGITPAILDGFSRILS